MSSTTKGILRLLRDLMSRPLEPLPRSVSWEARAARRETLSPRGLPATASFDRSAPPVGQPPRYVVNPVGPLLAECPALLAELDRVHIVRR